MFHQNKHEMSLKEVKIESDNSDNNIDELDTDSDTCDAESLRRLFPSCQLLAENKITSNNNYILQITATLESCPNIALGLSDNTCKVYTLNSQLAPKVTLREHANVITAVKFSPTNSNLLYSSAKDGSVRLWDLRTAPKSVNKFQYITSDKAIKSFNSFDISPNERLLSVGTDVFEGDSFILFWDLRKCTFLGGYWETHTDDITQVKFQDMNRFVSGSTDGLINIYDLAQTSESNALVETFNTNSSVEKVDWFGDDLGCITHTADLQFWRLEGVEPTFKLSRRDIATSLMRKSEDFIYIVNIHCFKNKKFVLCGSNYKAGECLRCLKIGKCVIPGPSFPQNKQIVRCSWLNDNVDLLLTGGEKGILNCWKFNFD